MLLMVSEFKGSDSEQADYHVMDVFSTIGSQAAIFALLSFKP